MGLAELRALVACGRWLGSGSRAAQVWAVVWGLGGAQLSIQQWGDSATFAPPPIVITL